MIFGKRTIIEDLRARDHLEPVFSPTEQERIHQFGKVIVSGEVIQKAAAKKRYVKKKKTKKPPKYVSPEEREVQLELELARIKARKARAAAKLLAQEE